MLVRGTTAVSTFVRKKSRLTHCDVVGSQRNCQAKFHADKNSASALFEPCVQGIPALFEPREGQQVLLAASGWGRLVQHIPVCATRACGGEVLQ